MSNIEKLAIEHLSHHKEYGHYKDDGRIVYTPTLKQLEDFAKAYAQQQSEPVGVDGERYFKLDDAPDNYEGDEAMAYVNGANFGYEVGRLDNHTDPPPNAVPLEKYNKLLQAMKHIEFATKPEPDDGSYHENAYTLASQAIAEAEGK